MGGSNRDPGLGLVLGIIWALYLTTMLPSRLRTGERWSGQLRSRPAPFSIAILVKQVAEFVREV